MTDPEPQRHPWRLPLLIFGAVTLGAFCLTAVYGPLNGGDWWLLIGVTGALVFWGFVRSLQHGPVFETRRDLSRATVEPVAERIRWALGLTAPFAIIFSLWVLIVSLFRGSLT